jgi:hypothetical protein
MVVVAKDEAGANVQPFLCVYAERAGPTSRFRRRAWREFQRALDPLAVPKPLASTRSARRVGSGADTD